MHIIHEVFNGPTRFTHRLLCASDEGVIIVRGKSVGYTQKATLKLENVTYAYGMDDCFPPEETGLHLIVPQPKIVEWSHPRDEAPGDSHV